MTDLSTEVRRVFVAALDVEADRRDEFVAEQCADAEMRAEVRALLAHDAAASGSSFLEAPAFAPSLTPGQVVDGYRVCGLLGEGGMGEVYLVEQHEPLSRRLALKLIKLGMDSRSVLARFEIERRTLARMNHTGIARVFDTGRTERGQPYFVMEYVPGDPITEYCESRELSIEARLRLLLQVCEAVQHAHQAGVIHRDLKPSNILVSQPEGGPVPKVIDFGLARAIDARRAPGSLTECGQILGTPEYMSPEQVDGVADAIDTRSDIYSLGAILYVLLTGHRPFEQLREDGDEAMRRRIREEAPLRPSARVGPARARRLHGDLDLITLKAMAKDVDARYPSVGELAQDLRRYLDGLPVAARPASAWYLARKFVGRHRGKVITAITASVAVLAGLVGTTIGFVAAEAARRDAERTLDGFTQLGYAVQVERALVEEENLYPAWPHLVPRMEQWLVEQGQPLIDETADVGWALERVRDRALPYDDQMRARDRERYAREREELDQLRRMLARLRAGGSEVEVARALERIRDLRQLVENRGTYTFTDEVDHVLHDGLARLIGELHPFTEPEDGTVARVRRRLAWAERVHALTIDDWRPEWQAAIDAVARDPRFDIELTPQLGLIPIGPDPATGLQEFAQLRSGAVPRRQPSGELDVDGETAIVFVLLPGGTFPMGAQANDPGGANYDVAARASEGPLHEVTLDPFFCSKYELTQGQWLRLTGDPNPSVFQPCQSPAEPIELDHPVENLSWNASDRLMRRHALMLPTEAQWEYACRAGSDTPWCTGADAHGLDAHLGAGLEYHAPVHAARPNAFGLYHVHGNVWEWCLDSYDGYVTAARPGDGFRELARRNRRVVRGGSFRDHAAFARSAYRGFRKADGRDATTGVRPVRAILPAIEGR